MTKDELATLLRSRDAQIASQNEGKFQRTPELAQGLLNDNLLYLLDEFPALVWRAGLDAKCNFFNHHWLQFTGRTMEQEVGDGWAEGVHPDDFDRCLDTYLTAFKARQPFEMEYRLKHRDGKYRWILDLGRLLHDADGQFSGYVGWCFDISRRKHAEESLQKNQHRLQQLAEQLFNAEEAERRKIASELHDGVGQTLALSKMRLKNLADELTGRSASLLINDILTLLDSSIQGIRSLTFQISSPLLYEVGLEAAVEALAERLSADHGLVINIEGDNPGEQHRGGCGPILFHAVRELLVNVIKHAAAQKAVVRFARVNGEYKVTVTDDGCGFDLHGYFALPAPDRGFGLLNIQQKIETVGGHYTIKSAAGRGTSVMLTIPAGCCEGGRT